VAASDPLCRFRTAYTDLGVHAVTYLYLEATIDVGPNLLSPDFATYTVVHRAQYLVR